MKPIQLSIQAFGPYVKKQVIPFDELAKHSLCLIQGETGSGKTVILDAITYALYGKSSGGQREDLESMRCRFAPEKLKTYVELIFSLRSHKYRFYRSVEMRKKRDGTLVPKVSIDAGSFDDGVFLPFFENPKLKNIEEKAVELIGLTHEQFIQVMMLPQGKFEQLLVSKSEEKQEILKTLFQSEHWGKICDQLSLFMKQKKDEMDFLQQKKEMLLQHNDWETVEDIEESWLALQKKKKFLEEQNFKEDEQLHDLQLCIQHQEYLHQQKHLLQTIRKEYEEAKKQKEQMQELKCQIEKQQQYVKWKPYYEACRQLELEKKQRIDAYQKIQHDLKGMKEKIELHPKLQHQLLEQEHQYLTLKQKLISYTDKAGLYQNLRDVVDKADQAASKGKVMEQRINSIEKRLKEYQLKMQQSSVWIEEANKQELLSKEYDIELLKLKQADEYQKQLRSMKQELQQNEADLESLHIQLHQKQAAYDIDKLAHDQYYEQYLNHSAYQLSELLQKDQPCPVCGSLHHPHPANVMDQYADLQNLQKLKKQMEQSQHALDTCCMDIKHYEITLIQLKEKYDEHRKRCKEFVFDENRYRKIQELMEESRNIRKKGKLHQEVYAQYMNKEADDRKLLESKMKDLQQNHQDIVRWNTVIEEWKKQLDEEITNIEDLQYKIKKVKSEITGIYSSMKQKQKQIKEEENAYVSLSQSHILLKQEVQLAEEHLLDAKKAFNNETKMKYEICDPEWFCIEAQQLNHRMEQLQEYEQNLHELTFQKKTVGIRSERKRAS